MLRESYLATSQFVTDLVEKAEGVDDATKRKATFFIKQAVDAASPSNFLMTNPAALRALLSTQGESLLKGVENLSEDLRRGKGALAISQTDLDAYKVGETIAASPGKVVFRNRVFELIQYAPATETVHAIPLLIFPPWINKFYILDLQPKNSMIRWLTEQGHTVFLVSWVNPGEDMASVSFEDYMREGVYAAVDAACEAAEVEHVNTVGYCVGGTLLAAALAHMAKTGDDRIQSATFLSSPTMRALIFLKARWTRPAACSTRRPWRTPSTPCGRTISSGTTSSTITISAKIRRRSICSIGMQIRRGCRKRSTSSICANSIATMR
jgi:polyhydroxyalkanoate synthase